MGNEDFRRELNNVFDGMAGSPSPALRHRVRSAIANPPDVRGPSWIVAAAAVVIVAVLISALVVANPLRHSTGPVGVGQPSPSATPLTSPSPSPTLTATPTPAPTTTPFPECSTNFGPLTQNGPLLAYVSDVRTGSHPGYDRITFTFSNGAPVTVEVRAQTNTTFTQGGSGQTVTLKGDSGLLVIFHSADAHTSYSGTTDINTGYSKLLEARQVEDYEGYVQWGLGVSGSACYRVTQLTNPNRVVVDVQTAG